MALALMVARGEDELICDFAETYRVLNWRGLPLKTAAILACGLSHDSRTMMKLADSKLTMGEFLSAAILDRLSLLVWQNTVDGERGRNQPKSVLNELIGEKHEDNNLMKFASGAEFEAARLAILEGR